MTEALLRRIVAFKTLVEKRLAKLITKSGDDHPTKSTEEGLKDLKADLKDNKEVRKLLDHVDEFPDSPEDVFNDFKNW